MDLPDLLERHALCALSPGELVVDRVSDDGLHEDGASNDGEREMTRGRDELVRSGRDEDEEEDTEGERVLGERFTRDPGRGRGGGGRTATEEATEGGGENGRRGRGRCRGRRGSRVGAESGEEER
jgi:hypothetical protein